LLHSGEKLGRVGSIEASQTQAVNCAMPSQVRLERIADRIRQEFSELLLRDLSDPRLKQVYVTDVTVDRELAHADVFVSALEGNTRSPEVLQGLESAGGFIRRELAGRVQLRSFPRLRFHWDPTPESADRIERMLADLRNKKGGSS
jgi:ribosome-binding factor A